MDRWNCEREVRECIEYGHLCTQFNREDVDEMVELITHGTPNIVCIQPFACLPNHVVGKGVIKALRAAYPGANIAAVD